MIDPSDKHPLGKRPKEAQERPASSHLHPDGKGNPARGYQNLKVAPPKGHPGFLGSKRKSK